MEPRRHARGDAEETNLSLNHRALPLIVGIPSGELAVSADRIVDWMLTHQVTLTERLSEHGAVLMRGFPIETSETFARIAEGLCGGLGDYVGGNSPRTRVGSGVFTATEYPPSETISLHNEASYLRRMPKWVLFYCQIPPGNGGQTPLADGRRVYRAIDSDVIARFAARGVRYVNNLHDGDGGLGRAWPDVFQTRDKRVVEERLVADGYDFTWKRNGGLQTSIVVDAIATHPATGELVWVNQAEQWHPSALSAGTRSALSQILPECEFPHYASFGDGTALDETDLAGIRGVLAQEERVFQWELQDLLICDNYMVMHGRRPFLGPRRILVAMR